MKKAFIVIALILALLFTLVACKSEPQEEEKSALEKRVSTCHDAVYVGANDDFSADFILGEKEKLIEIDGMVGEMTPFATLTVTPRSADLYNNTYTYTLKGEAGERSGELTKDVVGAAFTAEVEEAKEIGKVISVTVACEGILSSDVTLADKMEGTLPRKEILAIAEREFADAIKAETDTGNLEREIYVKLVNALSEDSPYYYYVSFIKSPSDYWALLLDPTTGEVISKKV